MTSPSSSKVDAVTPKICPFCRSPRIAASTGKVGPATYWRCDGCGEMWNVSRQSPKPTRWSRY